MPSPVLEHIHFPVARISRGAQSHGRITGWGGETTSPRSITLAYEEDHIQVTTYPEIVWGEMTPWANLGEFVSSSLVPIETTIEDRPAFAGLRRSHGFNPRMIELLLNNSRVQVTLVGTDDHWAAGCLIPSHRESLVILMTGGNVPCESLELELINDPATDPSFLGQR